MILELLRVINEASEIIAAVQKEKRNLVEDVYKELSSLDQMIEIKMESSIKSSTILK